MANLVAHIVQSGVSQQEKNALESILLSKSTIGMVKKFGVKWERKDLDLFVNQLYKDVQKEDDIIALMIDGDVL
jgi:hypothetical protein